MTSQLLCNASCFERIDRSNANASDLKQPLVVIQDLESSSSSSQEEQKTDIPRQRVSILILVRSFCFGAFPGLLLHAVTFSAFLVMVKKWGKHPLQPDESAPLSNWNLYLLFHIDIAFYALIWVGYFAILTREGSAYMRKKFDDDADALDSDSVWTPRFLVLSGIGFLLGVVAGSYGTWAIVDIALGMTVPLAPLSALLMDVVARHLVVGLCCLMIKCTDRGRERSTADGEPEEDQEDSFFV
jgi:hypothetical protein